MRMKMFFVAMALTLGCSSCMGLTEKGVNLATDLAMNVMDEITDSIDNEVEQHLMNTQKEGEFNQTYDIKDFKGIEAGGIFHIIYTQDKNYSVKISSNHDVLKMIKVRKHGDELCLDLEGHLSNMHARDLFINAYITAPTLNSIDLSGACAFTCTRLNTSEALGIDVSGAAKMDLGQVQCRSLDLDASGAMKMKGCFTVEQDVEWECSGAAKVDVEITAHKISIDNSGASKMTAKVNCQELKADNSGASKLILSGTADKTDFDNSGVSHIVTTDLNKF